MESGSKNWLGEVGVDSAVVHSWSSRDFRPLAGKKLNQVLVLISFAEEVCLAVEEKPQAWGS